MEGRELKVSFGKSGAGSVSPKVSIPVTDLRDMEIVPEEREIFYHYNKENKLMIFSKEDLSNYEIKLIKKTN